MMSTYFGSMTIVLKLPLTRAASTNGLQRYKGLEGGAVVTGDGGAESLLGAGGNVAEVGVGDRFARGARPIERLKWGQQRRHISLHKTHPIVLNSDISRPKRASKMLTYTDSGIEMARVSRGAPDLAMRILLAMH
jgi:hypothetical protein